MVDPVCPACGLNITDVGNYLITCAACCKSYHSSEKGCSSVKSDSWYKKAPDAKRKWKCQSCGGKSSKRKADTAIGDDSSEADEDDYDHTRKVSRGSIDESNLLSKMSAMLDSKLAEHLSTNLAPIRQGLDYVRSAIEEHGRQIALVNERVDALEQAGVCSNECEGLKTRIADLEQELWDNTANMEALQNYTRKDNLVFTNIPVSDKEDPYEVAIKAAGIVGVTIDRRDIVDCHRLPTRSQSNLPPSFVVKFVHRGNKSKILNEYRRQRPTAEHIGGVATTKIYANEHFAPYTSMLLREAKKQLHSTYEIIRCTNGSVYVKKTKTSPRINIVSCRQIGELKSGAAPVAASTTK